MSASYKTLLYLKNKKLKLIFTALLFICWCMLIWCINLFCLHSCTSFELSKFSDNRNNLTLPFSRKTKCLVAKLMFRLMIASCLSWISFTRRIYYNIRRRFFYLDNIWLQLPFINTEQEKENKKIGRIYFTEQQISLKMSSKDLSRKTFSEIRSCICNLLTIAIPLCHKWISSCYKIIM